MTRFVSGEAEMEENPILKASLSMASDIPLYAQLTGIIKNTITSGTLRVGDLLPSEAELCDKFEISRNTVRQAIGSLEEAGFVVRKRGKGTFVADPSTRRKGVQYSFTTEISSMGKHPSSTLVSFDIIDPAPKIKRLMALEDGVKVYCFTRVRNVDNEPLILETSYYPQHIYPNLTREMLETHSFYSLLYHVGVVPFAAEDSYEAVTLGEYEAKLLGCVPGAAAFHHQRRTTMENGLVYVELYARRPRAAGRVLPEERHELHESGGLRSEEKKAAGDCRFLFCRSGGSKRMEYFKFLVLSIREKAVKSGKNATFFRHAICAKGGTQSFRPVLR